MFSNKKNILQLVALLKAHGIGRAVLCPGSRNSPIVQTIANHPFFKCHAVTDERSAGFFAIGLALQSNSPVIVCCTSGTALLNLHPAVAEAYYQKIPLIVISADRPAAWIGQTDGQTVPQPEVFRRLVKKSVNLPEIHNEEDEWYCNRLINEVLLEVDHHGKGPVHINVPISEPLFNLSTKELPEVRVIKRQEAMSYCRCGKSEAETNLLIAQLITFGKRMIVSGQMPANCTLSVADGKALSERFAIVAEHTSNLPHFIPAIRNINVPLSNLNDESSAELSPDLLITYGGNILSKSLKKFLRRHPPKAHWHISPAGEIIDLYGALTTVIEAEPYPLLQEIAASTVEPADYPLRWKRECGESALSEGAEGSSGHDKIFSEQAAIGALLRNMPENSILHLGNSLSVRNAQLFSLPKGVDVYCNRGTSGIDGSLSTAVGYASASDKINFVVIGDLGFFYDMNALWNGHVGNNLRILLLNNGGGGIFNTLSGLEISEKAQRFVTGTHSTSAKGWAEERGFRYDAIQNMDDLSEAITRFTGQNFFHQSMLLEVMI